MVVPRGYLDKDFALGLRRTSLGALGDTSEKHAPLGHSNAAQLKALCALALLPERQTSRT